MAALGFINTLDVRQLNRETFFVKNAEKHFMGRNFIFAISSSVDPVINFYPSTRLLMDKVCGLVGWFEKTVD